MTVPKEHVVDKDKVKADLEKFKKSILRAIYISLTQTFARSSDSQF